MSTYELALNWIENANVTPGNIDLETATRCVEWIRTDMKDTDTEAPEDLTPESFMEAWNEIINK